ncbi:MAG: hypothetical protein E3J72_20545 [Planctomycetota bacterium]|nr:MAG: hypothetical protein E3J72_20545 [Planctomycetota bacterium]
MRKVLCSSPIGSAFILLSVFSLIVFAAGCSGGDSGGDKIVTGLPPGGSGTGTGTGTGGGGGGNTSTGGWADGAVLLLAHTSVFSGLSGEFAQFKSDLEYEGYTLITHEFTSGNHRDVRNLLKSNYDSAGNLAGVVLVGQIPYAKAVCNWTGASEPGRCDYYYMDLDGEWIDANGDGVFEKHAPGTGDRDPEIWCGRLYAKGLTVFGKSELQHYREYFERNHQYRTGMLERNYKAAYLTANPISVVPDIEVGNLSLLYPDTTLVVNAAYKMKSEISRDYEWIHAIAHGSPFEWEGVTVYDIASINPRTRFWNMHSCSTAKFTTSNAISVACLFNDHGLIVVAGTTYMCYEPQWDSTYTGSLQTETFGESYKAMMQWIHDNWGGQEDQIEWSGQEIIMMGDPTLKVYYD